MKLEVILREDQNILAACEELLRQSGFIHGEMGMTSWRGVRSESLSDSSLMVELLLGTKGKSRTLDIHATRFCHRTALLGCDQQSEEKLAADLRAILDVA
ncbi:MAG: hypothetical protein ACKOA1_11535 [Bacteroidota bacterium]